MKISAKFPVYLSVLCTGLIALVACRSSSSDAPHDVADAAPVVEAPKDLPRCRQSKSGALALNGIVQIGEAVANNGNIAVGVVTKNDGGLRQSIVSTRDALTSFDLMDVGPMFGDAPPPKPFYSRSVLFVAFYVKEKTRVLRVRPAGAALVASFDFPQAEDESFAFDVVETRGGFVVAWDEDSGNRGIIKVARGNAPPIVVSDDASDADSPKILALDDDRVLVSWLRRRAENRDAGRDHELERPAEDRAFRNVEYAIVDFTKVARDAGDMKDAKSPFPIIRATPENSHVIAIEPKIVRELPHLFVQDEGADADGAGGRILDITINPNDATKPASRVIVPKGVGHALIDYFATSSDAGYVSFTDSAERQMLAFVDARPDPRPSLEPAIESGRAVAALGSPNVLLGLRVSDETRGSPAELLKLECAP